MHWYAIGPTLTPLERAPAAETPGVVLLTSQELSQLSALPGLEETLRHTPAARDVRVCKAEVRPDCLSGTILFPKSDRGGGRLAFGWLLARNRAVLVDDGDFLLPYLRRMDKERYPVGGGVGRFFYGLLSMLTAKDLRRLEEIEDQAEGLEDRVLGGELEGFSPAMTQLRKRAIAWFRCYSQLDGPAAAGVLPPGPDHVPGGDRPAAEPDHEDPHRGHHHLSAPVPAGRVVRHELHRHARAHLEVRLSGGNRRQRGNRDSQPLDLQKEKVLVGVPDGSGRGRWNADTFPPLCGGKVLAALSERLAVQGIQSIRSHSRRAIAPSSSPPQRERIHLSRGFLTS